MVTDLSTNQAGRRATTLIERKRATATPRQLHNSQLSANDLFYLGHDTRQDHRKSNHLTSDDLDVPLRVISVTWNQSTDNISQLTTCHTAADESYLLLTLAVRQHAGSNSLSHLSADHKTNESRTWSSTVSHLAVELADPLYDATYRPWNEHVKPRIRHNTTPHLWPTGSHRHVKPRPQADIRTFTHSRLY